jgi:hypothetical protein
MRGLLGRDVIADSLVLAVDRDRGMLTIALQGKLSPPPAATAIGYRRFFERRLGKVTVAGRPVSMHIDLGGPMTQLWQHQIDALRLPRVGGKWIMTDEYGMAWQVDGGAIASAIQIGPLKVENVTVVPFNDRRLEPEHLDGALGQNVLSRFNIVANWHKATVWLSPRTADPGATAAARLARWGDLFTGCKQVACVGVQLVSPEPAEPSPEAGAPAMTPPGGHQLVVEREVGHTDRRVELLVEAVDAAGKPLGLPRLQITLPAGERTVIDPHADPNYAAAAGFRILDASPFARDCEPQTRRCIWQVPLR